MRQFGLLNAISTCRVSLDGKLNHTSSDLGRNIGVVSQFFSSDGVHRWFMNSRPDTYPKYSLYSSTDVIMKVVSEKGVVIDMRRPVYGSGSIFEEMSDQYSSRIPVFSTDSALTETSTIANAALHDQKCLIPFNLFGIPSDETPLYNVKKITLSITLYGDWWKRIFSVKNTTTATLKDIRFRRDKLAEFNPFIAYTVRTGPADSLSQVQRPFAVETAIVEGASNLQRHTLAAYAGKDAKSIKFDLSCIPKRSYIYVKAIETVADAVASHQLKEARMADLYGRIDSLTVRVGTKSTIVATEEASRLFDIARENGLNRSFNQAMYFTGFPAVIDYSETVGLEPGVLIGTPGSRNGGAPPLWIDLKFTNLSDEAVIYEIGCVHVYQGMLVSENNTWGIKQAFESSYDTNSGVQDLEQAIMSRYNYIGGRDGGIAIGSLFSQYLPKIGNGIKNLISAAFNDPNFRNTVVNTWNGTKPAAGGATFDDHAPMSTGGFYQHANTHNERGGNYVQQWSTR
jgi:hypothetical protein